MRTGPSVWVCRMKRPSNFSAEPSSTVSTIASPSSLATGGGIVVPRAGWRRAPGRAARRGRAGRGPRPRTAGSCRRRRSPPARGSECRVGDRSCRLDIALRREIDAPRRRERVTRSSSCASRHQARMPFWACRRFSASSNTTDCGPSITSSVTSSPRWAGRQCMKSASGLACAISRGIDLIGLEQVVAALRRPCRPSTPRCR